MSDFLPENELERALVLALNDPGGWSAFYSLLLESELFVLGIAEAAATPGKLSEIHLSQISFKDRIYHPIFSSRIRLKDYADVHPRYFTMKGRDLFASTRGAYFLLNPNSDFTKELLPEEIAEVLESGIPGKRPEPGKLLISKPVIFPAVLANALRELFATKPDVEAAYLAQMTVAGKKDPPHPILGVKFEGEWEPLAQEIQRVVAPLPQGTRVAAMQIKADLVNTELGETLMRYEPFYKRGSKLH